MDEVRLFLVRVWSRLRDGDAFRASVRALDSDRPQVFSRPEQIAAFLKDESDRSSAGCSGRVAAHPSGMDRSDGDADR
jgi:hypothetical protein